MHSDQGAGRVVPISSQIAHRLVHIRPDEATAEQPPGSQRGQIRHPQAHSDPHRQTCPLVLNTAAAALSHRQRKGIAESPISQAANQTHSNTAALRRLDSPWSRWPRAALPAMPLSNSNL